MLLVKTDNPQQLSEELRNGLTAAVGTAVVLPAVLPKLSAAVVTIRDRR